MMKKDEKILQYLNPHNMDLSDTYYCSVTKWKKEDFMYSTLEKVTRWVEQNGGVVLKIKENSTIVRLFDGFIIEAEGTEFDAI